MSPRSCEGWGALAVLSLLLGACGGAADDRGADPAADAGRLDGGGVAGDASFADAGGPPEAGPRDAGSADAADAALADLGSPDAGAPVDPLLGVDPAPQVLATGFSFTEGPAWHDGRLFFTDIPANTIHTLGADGRVAVHRRPSGAANGLFSAGGALYGCEHGGRRVVRVEAERSVALAERVDGARFNSPNDLAVRADGTIYFTDPEWGILSDLSVRERDVNALYRRDPEGGVHVEWSTPWMGHGLTPRPNGVILSPDERRLYMADDAGARVLVFEVSTEGATTQVDTWSVGLVPDGLTVDAAGNVYVATARGVEVHRPDGEGLWGRLEVPGGISNLTFGGDALSTLYATAPDRILAWRMQIPGVAR